MCVVADSFDVASLGVPLSLMHRGLRIREKTDVSCLA